MPAGSHTCRPVILEKPSGTFIALTFALNLFACAVDIGTDDLADSESLALVAGDRTFEVTLPSGQQYVEVFVRQNGIQNVATAIQASGVDNGDGTTTYALTRAGYAASDAVEYRFYSYLPGSPGVFTPGPIENAWYGQAAIPVTQDAAVVYSSLGTGPAAGRNFGAQPSVDVGEYHLTSEGLFGYSLAGRVPSGATITGAAWLVPAAYAPGGPVVHLRLNRVTTPWAESTVTWNSRPAYVFSREIELTSGAANRVDVTAEVAAAAASGTVSLAVQPSPAHSSTDNVFIDAREKVGGAPTSLLVTWRR